MTRATQNPDGTTQLSTHRWSWRRAAWPAYAQYLARSKRPILVGPWRGEIGFEVLYWIPFVEQFLTDYHIPIERIIPCSRGGAAGWYGAPSGIELYAMRAPQDLRVQNRLDVMKTGLFKQIHVTAFERAILRDARETLKQPLHVLHPAWMYHTLAPFWTGLRGLEWVAPKLRFKLLVSPDRALQNVTLPSDFVAVKFYARQTFPGGHKIVQKFTLAALEQLTSQTDVILLDPDTYLDDHSDLTASVRGTRIHHLSDFVGITPENNLAVQAAVLSKAMGFVGTYGGFAQLALRMGKPSVSFYLDWGNATSIMHRTLADALALKMGVPAVVLRIAELPMLNHVLPQMLVQAQTQSPLALPETPTPTATTRALQTASA